MLLTANPDVNRVGRNTQRNPHEIFHLPELFRCANKMKTGT